MVRVDPPDPGGAGRVAAAIRTLLGTAIIPEAVVAAVAEKLAHGEEPKNNLRGLLRELELDERLKVEDVRDIPDKGERRAEIEAVAIDELKRRLRSHDAEEKDATFTAVMERYRLDQYDYMLRPRMTTVRRPSNPPIREGPSLETAWLLYDERHSPVWAGEGDKWFGEAHSQAIAVSGSGRYLAIYASEPRAREAIIRDLRDGTLSKAVRGRSVGPVDEEILSRAFLKGRARLLWLRGIHRITDVKADTKQLAGPNLSRTLGLGDQSYFYSAGLADNSFPLPERHWQLAVGVAPHRSSVWAGSCGDWTEYCIKVAALLRRLEDATAERGDPLAVLAHRVADVDHASLVDPYDMSLIPPDLLADPWTAGAESRFFTDVNFFRFDDRTGGPLEFTVAVSYRGSYLGRLLVGLAPRGSGTTGLSVKPLQIVLNPPKEELGDEAVADLPPEDRGLHLHRVAAACGEQGWLTIRYGSGHAWSEDVVYRMVERNDLTFEGWRWRDFGATDITMEKPMEARDGKSVFVPERIGASREKSLFTWVVRHWADGKRREWLACDDGPGEIADFVHFDFRPEDKGDPVLSLIHVKASKSASPNRGISTSDYEIVVSQAIKNLRFLDVRKLADRLKKPSQKVVAEAVWHHGDASSRGRMSAAVGRAGVRYRRKVVVVQPHVVQAAFRMAREDQTNGTLSARASRLRQLETLLLEAESACHDLGARLEVVAAAKSRLVTALLYRPNGTHFLARFDTAATRSAGSCLSGDDPALRPHRLLDKIAGQALGSLGIFFGAHVPGIR